jgi:hypothetical protein
MPSVVLGAATSRLTLRLLSYGIIPKERSEKGRFSIARRSRDESLFVRQFKQHHRNPPRLLGVGASEPVATSVFRQGTASSRAANGR